MIKKLLRSILKTLFPFTMGKLPCRTNRRPLRFIYAFNPKAKGLIPALKLEGFTFGEHVAVCKFADLVTLTAAAHKNPTKLSQQITSLMRDEFGRPANPLAPQPAPPFLQLQLQRNSNRAELEHQFQSAGFQPGDSLVALPLQDWTRIKSLARRNSSKELANRIIHTEILLHALAH